MTGPHEINHETAFMLGDWRVDPASGRLLRGSEVHRLEPKAMTVLVCLARQPGQVLSREALEEQAWAGVVVGYDSLASAIIKLRKALGDDARNPCYIETVTKRGYRLVCDVQAVASADTQVIPATEPGASDRTVPTRAPETVTRPRTLNPSTYLLAAAFIVLLLVAVLYLTKDDGESVLPAGTDDGQPVIVVLPFRNLSDDVQQGYFSDGITADLITDLSKLSGLSVIARNSAFAYKNLDVDIQRLQQELGIDYVVEGSVRKAGQQVRISARLIDADNSINLWADRFDGTLDNIFAFQDAVTSEIISALEIKLTEKERTRLAQKYSNSIAAYDEFLHGWQQLWLLSRAGILQARSHLHRAIELDNRFARAYANLALTYIYDHLLGWSEDSQAALRLAHEFSDKAIAIDPGLPQVYWVKGFADIFRRDYQQALSHAQHAIDLDPNFADGFGLLANILNYAGKPEQADAEMRKAMQLNPRHPAIYKTIHGEIFFNMRDYARAIENFRFALEANPESEEPRLWLAAAYAHRGDIDEAHWQLEQIRFSGRELSYRHIEEVIPFKDPGQRKHFIDGLNKAGLENRIKGSDKGKQKKGLDVNGIY